MAAAHCSQNGKPPTFDAAYPWKLKLYINLQQQKPKDKNLYILCKELSNKGKVTEEFNFHKVTVVLSLWWLPQCQTVVIIVAHSCHMRLTYWNRLCSDFTLGWRASGSCSRQEWVDTNSWWVTTCRGKRIRQVEREEYKFSRHTKSRGSRICTHRPTAICFKVLSFSHYMQ
jgi:hypothetical protein